MGLALAREAFYVASNHMPCTSDLDLYTNPSGFTLVIHKSSFFWRFKRGFVKNIKQPQCSLNAGLLVSRALFLQGLGGDWPAGLFGN